MSKFTNFLKEVWGWIIAILVVLSGWFLIQRFFNKPSDSEQEILDNIDQNNQAIGDLETQVQNNLTHEQQLQQEHENLDQQIDNVYANLDNHNQQVHELEGKIEDESHNHQQNINYINNKYKK